jgi:hypothetical protein
VCARARARLHGHPGTHISASTHGPRPRAGAGGGGQCSPKQVQQGQRQKVPETKQGSRSSLSLKDIPHIAGAIWGTHVD